MRFAYSVTGSVTVAFKRILWMLFTSWMRSSDYRGTQLQINVLTIRWHDHDKQLTACASHEENLPNVDNQTVGLNWFEKIETGNRFFVAWFFKYPAGATEYNKVLQKCSNDQKVSKQCESRNITSTIVYCRLALISSQLEHSTQL